MYFAFWSDPDVGDIADDRDGCDSALSLWYSYNASDYDAVYGQHPPAVGFLILQGPIFPAASDSALYLGQWEYGWKNLPLTTFIHWSNSAANNGNPHTPKEVLNYMSGRWRNGQQITYGDEGTNPLSPPTHFMYSGDPETDIGWLSENSRHEFGSSGPFTMAPGDTQEVVMGILVSRGTSNTNSVTTLKNDTRALLGAYRDSLYTFFVPADPYIPPPEPPELPTQYDLSQNYPNPFNPGTEIHFDLPRDEEVTLGVYNTLGQRVAVLASGFHPAGTYTVRWEPRSAASGVYFYQLDAGRYVKTRRMILMK